MEMDRNQELAYSKYIMDNTLTTRTFIHVALIKKGKQNDVLQIVKDLHLMVKLMGNYNIGLIITQGICNASTSPS